MIKTIPNIPKISKITYHPRFSVICSIGLAPFHGIIDIEYSPGNKLLEFESFEKWLYSIANNQMTIEDLTRLVFDELTNCLGEIPLFVRINAETTVHAPASVMIIR